MAYVTEINFNLIWKIIELLEVNLSRKCLTEKLLNVGYLQICLI